MKVTGWTYWGDERYLDLNDEHTRIAAEVTRNVPDLPSREEFAKMSEEEQVEAIRVRREAFDKAMDCEELHEIDRLIEECVDVIVADIRNNGYHFTGNDHQNADWGVPIIDNKYLFCVSQRTWGGFIAAAYPDEIDNSEGYGYLKWAWTKPDGAEVKHWEDKDEQRN